MDIKRRILRAYEVRAECVLVTREEDGVVLEQREEYWIEHFGLVLDRPHDPGRSPFMGVADSVPTRDE